MSIIFAIPLEVLYHIYNQCPKQGIPEFKYDNIDGLYRICYQYLLKSNVVVHAVSKRHFYNDLHVDTLLPHHHPPVDLYIYNNTKKTKTCIFL